MENFGYERILVPTDMSDFADQAIRYASLLRRQLGSRITLLYADETYFPVDVLEIPLGYYLEQASRYWLGKGLYQEGMLALALHFGFGNPRTMVQIGGFAQAATLPIISCATLFLRFRRTDPRLAPSRLSDACLCLAAGSITIVAVYALGDQLLGLLGWSS